MVKNRAVESRKRTEEVRERLVKTIDGIVDIIHGYIDEEVERGKNVVYFDVTTLIDDCGDKSKDMEIAIRDSAIFEQVMGTLRKEGYRVFDQQYKCGSNQIRISWDG